MGYARWQFGCACCDEVASGDTPWCGQTDDKLYLTSGQFSSTLKTSTAVGSIDIQPAGISWDGEETPWCGTGDDKLYLTSGQFSTTLRDSQSVSNPVGISWDGTNTPHCRTAFGVNERIYLTSGQFESTIKTSLDIESVINSITGVSFSDGDTPASGSTGSSMKLWLLDGQFTTTVNTSQSLGTTTELSVLDISWDGTNTPWAKRVSTTENKLMLTSGQFSSTIKTSQSVHSIETALTGINTNKLEVG